MYGDHYPEGLEALYSFKADPAVKRFEEAIEQHPAFALGMPRSRALSNLS